MLFQKLHHQTSLHTSTDTIRSLVNFWSALSRGSRKLSLACTGDLMKNRCFGVKISFIIFFIANHIFYILIFLCDYVYSICRYFCSSKDIVGNCTDIHLEFCTYSCLLSIFTRKWHSFLKFTFVRQALNVPL